MLKRIFLGLLAGFFLLGVSPTIKANGAVRRRGAQANFVANELLVKFKSGTPAYVRAEIHRGTGATVIGRFTSNPRLEHVRLPAGENLDSVIAYYSTRADVQYAEKNFIYHLMDTTPNDPRYTEQWALASVNAPAAWDKTTGRFNVVVALIDSGVDYTHPDLALNIWTNPGEAGLKCTNGLDDDGDTLGGLVLIDDCRGWNFFDFNNDPRDVNGHGTQMAGVIGAMGNDALGIAGAAWDVQIMPLRASDSNGNISTAVAAQAIDYSIAHHATIINASWGGSQPSQTLLDAITSAQNAGQLFITAAGNQSSNNDDPTTPFYPCNYSKVAANVICVTATDEIDNLAATSNSGATTVQLGAPGNNILSTGLNQSYVSGSGTSQAAAYVTGGAALLKGCKASLAYTDIKNILLNNTRDDLALSGITTTGGVVNYQDAVNDASVGTCDSPAAASTPVADAGGSYNVNLRNQPVQFSGTRSSDAGGQLLLYFWDFGDGSFGAGIKPTHSYAAKGTYTATLFVRDNQGVIASNTATVNIRPNNIH